MLILPYVAPPLTYSNPVISQDAPDPGVLKTGQDYFMAATGGDREHGAFPIYRSEDLIHWQPAGSVLANARLPAGAAAISGHRKSIPWAISSWLTLRPVTAPACCG